MWKCLYIVLFYFKKLLNEWNLFLFWYFFILNLILINLLKNWNVMYCFLKNDYDVNIMILKVGYLIEIID